MTEKEARRKNMPRIAFCLLITLTMTITALASQAKTLLPIKTGKDGLYGYTDTSGSLAIKAKFSEAGHFIDGLAAVLAEDEWFFIAVDGTRAFAGSFAEAKDFGGGLAPVKVDEFWGYIDTHGKIAIKPQFEEAYSFSEGLACVQIGQKENGTAKYGYIERDGKFAIEPNFKFFDNQFFSPPTAFSEGLASAWLENKDGENKVGYFDKTGRVIIEPAFIEGGEFVNGIAPVNVSDSLEGGGRFIRRDGTFAFPEEYARTGIFSNGLAPVAIINSGEEPSLWGYLDEKGKMVIQARFSYAEPFKNGFARVFTGDFSSETYIDTDGNPVVRGERLNDESDQRRLEPDNIVSSSFLPAAAGGKIDYKPENLVDGNLNTAWIEGVKGNGVGEWVEFQYEGQCNFKKLFILNGYQKKSAKGQSSFGKNLRPARIKVATEMNQEQTFDLTDTTAEQVLTLNMSGHNLRITIEAVHQTGQEAHDCGFSEISVFGNF